MLKNEFMTRFQPFMEVEGAGGGGAAGSNEPNGGEPDGKQDPKDENKKDNPRQQARYSDEDLDRIIDKKFAKWKEQEEERVKEAERLAKMNAQQKVEHERDKEKKRADEAEARLNRYGLTDEARGMLEKENIKLGAELLDVLVGNDAETTKANVESFTKLFNDAIEDEVKKRLAGKTPKTGGKSSMTKSEIMKVSDPIERRKLIAENMELFN